MIEGDFRKQWKIWRKNELNLTVDGFSLIRINTSKNTISIKGILIEAEVDMKKSTFQWFTPADKNVFTGSYECKFGVFLKSTYSFQLSNLGKFTANPSRPDLLTRSWSIVKNEDLKMVLATVVLEVGVFRKNNFKADLIDLNAMLPVLFLIGLEWYHYIFVDTAVG